MIQTTIDSALPRTCRRLECVRGSVAFRSAKVRPCPAVCKSLATFAERKATLIHSRISARPWTAQSYCVPKADIASQGYDLSLNRYKEVVHEEVEHRPPLEILAELDRLEEEIQTGLNELQGMLK